METDPGTGTPDTPDEGDTPEPGGTETTTETTTTVAPPEGEGNTK